MMGHLALHPQGPVDLAARPADLVAHLDQGKVCVMSICVNMCQYVSICVNELRILAARMPSLT